MPLRSKVMKKPWFCRVGLGASFITALRKICNRREYKATVDETKVHDDLAPSDYYFFSKLKKDLRRKEFDDDDEVKTAVMEHFAEKNQSAFGRAQIY